MGKGLPARRQGRSRKTVRKVKGPRGEPGAKPSNQGGARPQGGGESSPPILTALALARKGVKVFPCKPDKSPYTSNGFKAGTVDEARIRKWWDVWPEALVGVPTGQGLSVLDIDLKGATVEERLSELPQALPQTRIHATRSGGRHYVFSDPRGALRTRAGVLPGIDTRGKGGYVVWWSDGPPNGDVAPIPKWLLELAPVPKTSAKSEAPRVSATIAALGWPIIKKQIERELATLDPNVSNTEWSEIGMALHHESGGLQEALDMWEAWSIKATRLGAYRPGETLKRWRSFPTDREAKKTWAKAVRDARAAQGPSQEPPEASSPDRPKGVYAGPELYEMDHSDPEPILDGSLMLGPGVFILAGKPKDGKTWLAQNLACAMLSGREYAGTKPREPGAVVYLNLDDGNTGRFFRRLRDMGLTKEESSKLILAMGVDAQFFPSAFAMVSTMLKTYEGVRLVVIDTLGSFRTNERKEGVYQQEYGEVRAINELAHEYNICVLLVHHFRKGAIDANYPFESISGTLGLQGGADGMIVLHRKDYHHPTDSALDQKLGAIWCRGRDLDGDIELGARLHEGQWRIVGGVDDVLMSSTLHDVLNVMRQQPEHWFTSKEVAAEIDGAKVDAVRKALQRAVKRGSVISRVGNGGGFKLRL